MTALYTGWLRPEGSLWRRVCSAPTEAQCWELLLAAPAEGRSVERLVRKGEKHPDHRKRPR